MVEGAERRMWRVFDDVPDRGKRQKVSKLLNAEGKNGRINCAMTLLDHNLDALRFDLLHGL